MNTRNKPYSHKISRLTIGLMGLALLFSAGLSVHAVETQDIEIHVSINATKSLAAGTTHYNFGALATNVSSVSATALVITNDSAGLIQTYTLVAGNAISDTAGTDWTLNETSTGTDQYRLAAQFSTARPTDADGSWATDYMTTGVQACTAVRFGNGEAAESGLNVNPSAARNLWFRIHTPDVVSDPSPHTATVTLAVQ
jgi:hypothetical protein